jgi:hypothetical protein
MKKKNKAVSFISCTIIFSVFLTLPSFSFAQVYDNIGFKKDVPEEIRKACTVCDEFLDVKWIDERRHIGKLKTEWYKDGKKEGVSYYLVRLLEPSPGPVPILTCIFYNIDEERYHSKNIEKLIKEADKFEYALVGDFIMYAKKGKRQIQLGSADSIPYFPQPGVSSGQPFKKTFSNFSKTICVLYPNKEYVSIAETKKPFIKESLSEEEKKIFDQLIKFANNKCKEITGADAKCYTEMIKYCDVIDANFDGLDDYIFRFSLLDELGRPNKTPAIWYIYFSKGDQHKFKELRGCFSKQSFMPIFYSSVGKRIIYYTLCNLTEIIQGGN